MTRRSGPPGTARPEDSAAAKRAEVTSSVSLDDDLLDVERDQLAACEAVIDAGLRTFVEVGTALATIRDRSLYRETHPSFAAYVRDRFGLSVSYAYRQIDAARVVDALSPIGDKITNEAQARELVSLVDDPNRLREVVAKAEASGPITAAGLRRAREVTPLTRNDRPTKPPPNRQPPPALPPRRPDAERYKDSVVISAIDGNRKYLSSRNAIIILAYDVKDALAAGDQRWVDQADDVLRQYADYLGKLRRVISDPQLRAEALDTPYHREDVHIERPTLRVVEPGEDGAP